MEPEKGAIVKKKMESIDDPLFTPLDDDKALAATVAAGTQHISLIDTNNPNPDEVYDFG